MSVVGWQDGAAEQISNILNSDIAGKDKLNKIIRIKHNPSQSGKEQPADLCNSYKTMKSVSKITTLKGEPITII